MTKSNPDWISWSNILRWCFSGTIPCIKVASLCWQTHRDAVSVFVRCIQFIHAGCAKKSKHSFAKSYVKYAGHIIGCGKHRPDPEHTKAVAELKLQPQENNSSRYQAYFHIITLMCQILQRQLSHSQILQKEINPLFYNGVTWSRLPLKHSVPKHLKHQCL